MRFPIRGTLNALTALLLLAPMAEGRAQLLTNDFGGTQATQLACTEYDPSGWCYVWAPVEVGTNGYAVQLSGGLISSAAVVGYGMYGLGGNGTWTGGPGNYAGTDGAGMLNYGIRFQFAQPVVAVGAWMNYAPGMGSAFLRAFGSTGNLLAQYDLTTAAPISTGNAWNGQAFRGVQDMGGIFAFELTGSYLITRDLFVSNEAVVQAPEVLVIDLEDGKREPPFEEGPPNVTTTPEPGTWALMVGGLIGLGVVRRRRRSA